MLDTRDTKMEHNTETKPVLRDIIQEKVNTYLNSFDTKQLTNFNEMFLSVVEPPLLTAVLERSRYNQVQAAKMLGISRGTLRKKLKQHFDDEYCSSRD
jgi:Fis family transcriptional regulator